MTLRRRAHIALFVAALLIALALAFAGYRSATSNPVIRRLRVTLADYPSAAAPIRVALVSDLHVQGPDMPPSRVRRIVKQINVLHPDIVVAAGDFRGTSWIARKYADAEAVAPLSSLRAPLGVYAVLGNNDYEHKTAANTPVREALQRAGVHVLGNQVARAGPLAIGGLEGRYSTAAASIARRRAVEEALKRTPGAKVLVAHRPDEFRWAPRFVGLTLAGHTHCGQIVFPLIGALETGSDFGSDYLCGVRRDGGKLLVVTAGLGTSRLPIRIGAPPDIWLIELRPEPRGSGAGTAK